MSYGICRCAKVRNASSSTGAYIHNEREKSYSHSNPDIDFSKSKLNYSHGDYENMTYNQRAEKRIQEGYTGKKAVRKDAVRMVEFLFAPSSPEALDDKSAKEFLKDSYDWLCDRYGKENVIADKVHLDETTPHMHAMIVPLTPDGRLSAKEVLGGPVQMQELQDDFYQKVSRKYHLERGQKAELDNPEREQTKHLSVQEYKKQTIVELERQIQELEEAQTIKEKELSRLNAQSELTSRKIQKQDAMYQMLNQSVQKLEKDHQNIKDDISTLNDQKSNLGAKLELLEREIEIKQKINKELEEKNKIQQELIGILEQKVQKYQKIINNISQSIKVTLMDIFDTTARRIMQSIDMAYENPKRANLYFDKTIEDGHKEIDEKIPEESIKKPAKELITEQVETAAKMTEKEVPTFRRSHGMSR